LTQREFGRLPEGRAVHEYTLDNGRGLRLSSINTGTVALELSLVSDDGDEGYPGRMSGMYPNGSRLLARGCQSGS
jgi:galactose mutarotase-like enzyme